jgi:hypothetical protein
MSTANAEAYLKRFGYLAGVVTDASMGGAVLAFRRAFGLPHTDQLDEHVVAAMAAPRCGLPDYRLASEEARWRRTSLTYFVRDYVGGRLSRQDQDDLVDLAWKDWMGVADVKLTRASSEAGANIIISAGRGPQDQFDGPRGTLAWAQLPPGGDQQLLMKFDLDESWMRNANEPGILCRNVACHEFGHLLGLDHSSRRGALMAPFYAAGTVSPQPDDDIPRIQALYGPAKVPPPPPPPSGKTVLTLELDGDVTAARVVSVGRNS